MKKIHTYIILVALLTATLAYGSGSHGPFFWKLVQGVLSPVDSSVTIDISGGTITGTFTGATIPDNPTIPSALQALETAVESAFGFTNLTDFDTQTAWRVFYSDTNGDVTELALGADGTYLKSNGASAAPTFDAPTAGLTAASVSDVNTGTSTTKAVTPDALAGSSLGTKNVIVKVAANSVALTTGDTKDCFVIPIELNGMNLASAGAHVYTVSSSGLPTFMVHKKKISDASSVDMLTTVITVDANERDSSTAAAAPVIDAANDDVATGDEVCVDVDIAGTGTLGGEVRFGFRLP